MSDYIHAIIKIEEEDCIYQLYLLEDFDDDDDSNDIYQVLIESPNDECGISLKRSKMYFFNLLASGRKFSSIKISIPKVDYEEMFYLNQNGKLAVQISVPVF